MLRRGGAFSLGRLKLAHEKGKTACSNSHTSSRFAPQETACARCRGPRLGLNHCGWLFMLSCPSRWPPTECGEGNAESPGSWSRCRPFLKVSNRFVTFRSDEYLSPFCVIYYSKVNRIISVILLCIWGGKSHNTCIDEKVLVFWYVHLQVMYRKHDLRSLRSYISLNLIISNCQRCKLYKLYRISSRSIPLPLFG